MRRDVSGGIDPVSNALPGVVFGVVAVLAQQLQVCVVQGDAWDADILRGQVGLVMDNLSGADQAAGEAPFAQPPPLGDVAVTAGRPGGGAIERFCKILGHRQNKKPVPRIALCETWHWH